MHILVLSLAVAFVVCTVLLMVLGVFATTPLGRRIERDELRHRAHSAAAR